MTDTDILNELGRWLQERWIESNEARRLALKSDGLHATRMKYQRDAFHEVIEHLATKRGDTDA